MATPQPPEPSPQGPGKRTVLLFICAFGISFLAGSWGREPWPPDEPRTALLARDMEENGRWLFPEYEGKPWLDQPPLAAWLAAASRIATRSDAKLGYRLPVALLAAIGLWITYAGGRRLFDGRIAFLAACIQASTYWWFRRASWLDDDLYFAVGCHAAILGFAIAARRTGSPTAAMAGWAGLAFACLAKSIPLAFALVFPPLAIHAFMEGGLGAVRHGTSRVLRPLPLLLWAAIVLPWYAAAMSHGSSFIEAHVVGQHLGRLWSSPADSRPLFQYVLWIPVLFLPWTLFLPLGLLHGKDRMARAGERLAIVWAILGFVILSFASSKKPGYALVLWPPLALLVAAGLHEGREWHSVWEDYLREGLFRIVPYLLRVPLVAVLAAGVLYAGGWWRALADERVAPVLSDASKAVPSLVLALAASAAAFRISFRIPGLLARKNYPSAAFDLATAALVLFAAKGLIDPAVNGIFSKRDLLAAFDSRMPPGAPVALYGRRDPEVSCHLRRPIERLDYPDPLVTDDPRRIRVEEFIRRPARVFIIATAEDFERLQLHFQSLGAMLGTEAEGIAGPRRERILLLSNRRE